MKYFLHDCNSFNDEKISELFLNFGYEGLGLFYTILEKIGSQEKPIKTIVLKSQLKIGKRLEKCWKFMEQIGMISSNNGDTFNERILSYSETYQIKKEKNREKISDWREKQSVIKNVTSYEPICNLPKVNKSKVKESKEEIVFNFPNFKSELFYKTWDILIKEKKWKNKSPAALQKSLEHLGRNSETDAIEMMNNTISGDWQGLFDLKKEKQYANTTGINSKQLGTYQLLEKLRHDRESNNPGKASFGG